MGAERKRIAFLIWDGPLHDALKTQRRYLWDEVLATAQTILDAEESTR